MPQITVAVASAASGWDLLMQSGVGVPCTVGMPLQTLLHQEFCLRPEQTGRIDVILLNGKPVDAPETAIVPDGARLALAAGLPGIAGLAMKSGSAVRGLRSGITFREESMTAGVPSSGKVELALFSLAITLLAGHFLARGVILRAEQFIRYARRAKDESCRFCGHACSVAEAITEITRLPELTPIFLTVSPAAIVEDHM